MSRDDTGKNDFGEQGKQFVSDLRETVTKKVAENEDTLRGTVGKAARWIDEKTGGKYAETIAKAETKVGDGIGWAATQGTGDASPSAPGSAAGDGTDPNGPDASTGPATPPAANPPGANPPGPVAGSGPTAPRPDAADWPEPPGSSRPPQDPPTAPH